MLSTLNNRTLVHDDNLIGILNCGKTMGYNDNSLLTQFDQFVECLLDLMLTFSIQSTSGFIQKKNLGLANKCTSDSYALLLASRKLNTSSSD